VLQAICTAILEKFLLLFLQEEQSKVNANDVSRFHPGRTRPNEYGRANSDIYDIIRGGGSSYTCSKNGRTTAQIHFPGHDGGNAEQPNPDEIDTTQITDEEISGGRKAEGEREAEGAMRIGTSDSSC
jgi:hypothetical protein